MRYCFFINFAQLNQYPMGSQEQHHSHSHHHHHHSRNKIKKVSAWEGASNGLFNLLNFKGRMRRSEYWWFFGAAILLSVIVFFGFIAWEDSVVQDWVERQKVYTANDLFPYVIKRWTFPFYILIGLLFAAQVRRFHDIGHRAWLPVFKVLAFVVFAYSYNKAAYAVNSLTPDLDVIGWTALVLYIAAAITIAYIATQDSEKEKNRYGVSPKYRRKLED